MKKTVLVVVLCSLIALGVNANAMTLSQPIKLGSVWLGPPGYFEVNGATYHVGKPYTNQKFIKAYHIDKQNKNGKEIYDKGIARFGSGTDSIYLHYDGRDGFSSYRSNIHPVSKYGGEDIKNTLDIGTGITNISLIRTDSSTTLYLLTNKDAGGFTGTTHIVLGKKKDGTFVQYFDTRKMKNDYFSQPREFHFCDDVIIHGDTIVIPYKWLKNPAQNGHRINVGEFRFKWDEKAQWFGIEQVVY